MAKVTMKMNPGDRPTKEQFEEIRNAANKDVVFTEDAPELTAGELTEFRPANSKYYRPNKELISLRLDSVLVDAFKSTGKGYQTRINEALWKGATQMGIIVQK